MSQSTFSVPDRGSKRPRLSVDLDPESKGLIDSLVERSGSLTISELIRRALALYFIVVEHRARGGKLVFRHSDGRDETLMIL